MIYYLCAQTGNQGYNKHPELYSIHSRGWNAQKSLRDMPIFDVFIQESAKQGELFFKRLFPLAMLDTNWRVNAMS